MSIDRWNRDDSAHKRIDDLEKQISDMRGKKVGCEININAQATSESLREAIISSVTDWAEKNSRPGGKLNR